MKKFLKQAPNHTTVLSKDESQSQASELLLHPFWYLAHYIQDGDGFTHLHTFMLQLPAHHSFVERLIDATWPASLLDITSAGRMTALHLAATGNEAAIVRQLLVAGANPLIKNNGGFIPLHYACENGNIAMIDSLTRSFDNQEIKKMRSKNLVIPDLSKSVNMRNNQGVSPLHLVTESGHLDAMQLLLKLGADINVMEYKNGDRALHIAIKKGYKDMTQFLLDYYRKCRDANLTFLHYDYFDLIKHLEEMGLDQEFNETFKISVTETYQC